MEEEGKETSAGGVVFKEGQVVLLRRHSGEWVMPKGHVEPGETPEEAALREVEEETGLRARILARVGETSYAFTLPLQPVLRYKTVHWFLMEAEGGAFCPESTFGEGAVVSPEQAVEMLTFEKDRGMLRRALLLRRSTVLSPPSTPPDPGNTCLA
ncbi:MAG: NUDIX hydrolase [Chloroflexota bacterium]|nr:MAG: NUDIX hydrolase [Chloroflexota bacterium]